MQDPSLPHESVAYPSNIDDTSGLPQSSRVYTASEMIDFCATANGSPELQTQDCRFDPRQTLPVSCTMADNSTRVRSSTSSLPNRAKEYPFSGKPLAVSIDGSIFPFPDATLFDDFLEVESSLQSLEADEGIQLSDGFCTPSNGDTLHCTEEYVSAKGKPGSGIQQLKNISIGKCSR